MNPEIAAQGQLDAYNDRDIDRFLSWFSKDVELYNFGEDQPFLTGLVEKRKVYGDVFDNSPHLHAQVDTRIVIDNKVIDHEIVRNRKEIEYMELLVVYEVKDGLINRVTFIRKSS